MHLKYQPAQIVVIFRLYLYLIIFWYPHGFKFLSDVSYLDPKKKEDWIQKYM
jgi:hypothetical protein